jgi:hypothetical protein
VGFLKGEKFSSIGLMDRTPRMERPTMREQINVFYCRCDHQYPSCKSGLWSIPTVNQSCDKERNLHFLEEVYQMGSGFPRRRMVDSYNSLFWLLSTSVLKMDGVSLTLSTFSYVRGLHIGGIRRFFGLNASHEALSSFSYSLGVVKA